MIVASDLPKLPSSQDHEAWFMGSGDPRPAGLIDDSSGSQLLTIGLGEATQIGITVEPKSGSKRPTNPIITASVPA